MLEKAAAYVKKAFGKRSLLEDRYARAATFTSLCLVVLATPFALAHVVGDPIHCWVAREWSQDNYFKFVSSYCYWAGHLYSHTMDRPMPHQIEDGLEERARVSGNPNHTRWVIPLLLLQALLFYLPRLLRDALRPISGLAGEELWGLLKGELSGGSKEQGEKLDNAAAYLKRWLQNSRTRRGNSVSLTLLHVLDRLVLLSVSACQVAMVTSLTGVDFSLYGLNAARSVAALGTWQDEENFPRMAWCDLPLRIDPGDVKIMTLQCVLGQNIFIERLFVVLWWLFVAMTTVAAVGLLEELPRLLPWRCVNGPRAYVKQLVPTVRSEEKVAFREFVSEFLGRDGLLLLRMTSQSTCPLLTSDLAQRLWEEFKATRKVKEELDCA